MGRHLSTMLVVCGLSLVGCGKKDGTASKPGDNPLNAPADYVEGLGKAQVKAVKTIDTASINQAIQMFEASEGRRPKSLEELVSMKYMPALPEPPRGMKFSYDPATGTVKVIPK